MPLVKEIVFGFSKGRDAMTDMTLEEAVMTRRSVRGFLPKPVPQALLVRVFELAQWAPSGTNVQSWQVCVGSGATRDALREPIQIEGVPLHIVDTAGRCA